MRTEVQRWDRLRPHASFAHAGVGVTGLQPQVALYRVQDGFWYDNATTAFDSATAVYYSMTAVDAVQMPGVYEYVPNPASFVSPDAGQSNSGYIYVVKEPESLSLEITKVHVENAVSSGGTSPADIWNYDIDATSGAEKAGSRLRDVSVGQMLGEGATRDSLHVCTVLSNAPEGYYHAATIPAPSAEVTEAYGGRRAVYYRASDNRAYPCVVSAVGTGGSGPYFILAREDGAAWDLDIAVSDKMYILTDLFQSISASAVWSESTAAYTSVGTFGEGFRRMLALRQENMRVVYTAWNDVNVPTAGTIYIYPSKVAMDADTGGTGVGSFGSYVFTATFTGTPALQPTIYTSGKTT